MLFYLSVSQHEKGNVLHAQDLLFNVVSVQIYNPLESVPIYQHRNLMSGKVRSAVFVPKPDQPAKGKLSWMDCSQLYFTNSELVGLVLGSMQVERTFRPKSAIGS